MPETFITVFKSNLVKFRDKTAMKDPVTGEAFTYGELDTRAGRIASKLKQMGVEKGSAVAIVLPQSIEFVTSMIAVMKLGAAFVPPSIFHILPKDLSIYLMIAGQRQSLTQNF